MKTSNVEVPPNHGLMTILDRSGDTAVLWDRADPEQVEETRRRFDEIIGQGYLAEKTNTGYAQDGEQIREFDPQAQRIVMRPPLVGG